jgi:hypothetical protein
MEKAQEPIDPVIHRIACQFCYVGTDAQRYPVEVYRTGQDFWICLLCRRILAEEVEVPGHFSKEHFEWGALDSEQIGHTELVE